MIRSRANKSKENKKQGAVVNPKSDSILQKDFEDIN